MQLIVNFVEKFNKKCKQINFSKNNPFQQVMGDLCRLCAAVRKTDLLRPLTVVECEKLKDCFALEILCQSDDELPKCACCNCLATLNETYAFYNKIKESQESLSLLYNLYKSRNIINENSDEICKKPNNLVETNIAENSESLDHNAMIIGEGVVVCKENDEIQIAEGDEEEAAGEENVGETGKMAYTENEMTSCYEIIIENSPQQVNDGVVVDEYELLYQVEDMPEEHDATKLPESITLEYNDCNDAEADSKESENSEEIKIETYVFEVEEDEEDQDSLHEQQENVPITRSKVQQTLIETLPKIGDASVEPKLNRPTNTDKIEILEWKNYTWICRSCLATFNNFTELYQHAQENHNANDMQKLQFECADCHKICVNYNKLLNHVRFRHHSKLKLRCDVCDIEQKNYEQLADHRGGEMCCEAEAYPQVDLCIFCGKSFMNRTAELIHTRAQHNDVAEDKNKCQQCGYCNKQFKRLQTLRAHEQTHIEAKEFTCDICDKKFRQRVNLEVHMYAHIEEKSFECKICKKTFKTPTSLEKHHKIHKQVKNFNCDFCEKTFHSNDEKRSHERIHTGEKPYQCPHCDRAFRFRSGLTTHIYLHTFERPYACQYCDMRFTNWGNMNKHQKICKKRKEMEKFDELKN